MKSILKILAMVSLALLIVQCEVIDPDLLEDPNNPSPENVDADFLFNNIQQEARTVYAEASVLGAELTRMRYMFGSTYQDAYTPTSFDGVYENAYADLFIDVQNLMPIAEERELYYHMGVAKTLKAYAMLIQVDMFGDMPLSQALDESNFNPDVNEGTAVYDSALVLLDDAISDLETESAIYPENDLYYGSLDDGEAQADKWIRAANTMKLKAYLNTGNNTAIQTMLDNGAMLIDEPNDNLTFEFGTNISNPDSRHPLFSNNYVDVANDYMANSYMNMMLNDKSDMDPRTPYYFYRQTTSDPTDVNLKTCINSFEPTHFQPSAPFCTLGDGYWGRDHLVADGIPPDGDLRSTFGVYPAGGAFDNGQGESTEPDMSSSLQGAGFSPIMMSSYTHFILAEYYSRTGAAAAAESNFEEAIRESFSTVQSSAGDLDDGLQAEMTNSEIDDYVAEALNNFGNDAMRNIAKEYYLALWPNGVEAYNLMRRTGYPDRQDGLQPAFSPSPGSWYNSLQYPAAMVERNGSISQKDRTETVFWDDGNYDFSF